MNNRIKLGIASLLAITALGYSLHHFLEEAHYDRLVVGIIDAPQRYDGSHVDDLVDLGSESVGAIGRALLGDVEFPLTLVMALDRIGSKRGVDALLEFLGKQARYSDEYDAVTYQSILALRGVGSRKACDPLEDIFHDPVASPRLRLYAAQSIAHVCETEEARTFILEAYRGHDGIQTVASAQGYTFGEVALALTDVDTDESEALLLALLKQSYTYSEPLIEHLTTRGGSAVVDAFLDIVDRKADFEFPSRLAAVRGLVAMDVLPRPVLLPITEDLAIEAEERFADWPAERANRFVDQYLAEARRLRVLVASR
jgi:hypothetical protein